MYDLRGLIPYRDTKSIKLGCFSNFRWTLGPSSNVSKRRVARASQPNYDSETGDSNHQMSLQDIDKLKVKRVSCVINFNSRPLSAQSRADLLEARIGYIHFSTGDWDPPRPKHLWQAAAVIDTFSLSGTVLVYCGYGQGRTGTAIAGWAMTRYFAPHKANITLLCSMKSLHHNFGVETVGQANAVRTMVNLPPLDPSPKDESYPSEAAASGYKSGYNSGYKKYPPAAATMHSKHAEHPPLAPQARPARHTNSAANHAAMQALHANIAAKLAVSQSKETVDLLQAAETMAAERLIEEAKQPTHAAVGKPSAKSRKWGSGLSALYARAKGYGRR